VTAGVTHPSRGFVTGGGLGRFAPAALLAGACAVSAITPVADDDGLVLCPYRLATGGWCPGCGCTRAVRAVTRFDLGPALALNPWAVILMAQAFVLVGWMALAPERLGAWWRENDTRFLAANLVLGLAIWMIRVTTGSIPGPF
jgi:hypothetical protein